MSGIPTAAEIEAAKALVQANVETEAKKQSGSTAGETFSGAVDTTAEVVIDGVGEVVVAAVGTVVEGIGTVAGVAVEGAVAVIGGIFEGLTS
jgi:hypothetical protein